MICLATVDLSQCYEEIAALKKLGVTVVQAYPTDPDWSKLVQEMSVYISGASVKLTRLEFKDCKKLELVLNPNTGQDHIDFNFLEKRNVDFFTIKDKFKLLNRLTATSEISFGLLLSYVRNIRQATTSAEEGRWERELFKGFQLSEKKLGIVGLGRLGKISSKIGLGFSMEVAYCDPFVEHSLPKFGLKELFRRSDIIMLHVHLDNETRYMVNKNTLKDIGRGKILVNTSRGQLVEDGAILEALDDGVLAGYLTDVIDGEWETSSQRFDHPLVKRSREKGDVLISPHIGGSTNESIFLARSYVLNELKSWILNKR